MTKKNERGTALMFAIFMLLILSAGTGLLWQQLQGNLEHQRQSWHHEQAFQLAEAGLQRAVAELRAGSAALTDVAGVPLGPGTYSVTVLPGRTAREFRLESWGRINGGQRHFDRVGLTATLQLAPNGEIASFGWVPIRGNNQ